MARIKDREKALILRKQGMSYSQIKAIINVAKSTLSLWLRDYPLPKKRIRELRDRNEQRIEKYRETMRKKKEERLKQFYNEQKKLILPLSKSESFIAGLFLYWGEGTKNKYSISISNSDPSVINFFIYWLTKIMLIPKEKIKIYLQLYNDMDIRKEIDYWSKTLIIPINQFSKPYIKKTSSDRINHKGGFGHGTCNATVGNARLSEKVLMSIKVITDVYGKTRT
jgi:hypothetical protein